MRFLGAAILATSLAVSGAYAAPDSTAPLAPGKPAGVKNAALHAPIWVWVAGVGFVALGVGLVASGNGNNNTTTTTTTTTP